MNSFASTDKAFDGRATPKVSPPAVALLGTGQVSKMIPVLGSVYLTGVLLCAEVKGRARLSRQALVYGGVIQVLNLHGTMAASATIAEVNDFIVSSCYLAVSTRSRRNLGRDDSRRACRRTDVEEARSLRRRRARYRSLPLAILYLPALACATITTANRPVWMAGYATVSLPRNVWQDYKTMRAW